MSTSIIEKISHSRMLHRSSVDGKKDKDDPAEHQKEKDFIIDFERHPEPLSPDHIAEDPKHKKLGHSSHQLKIEDFQLIKTLGTGESRPIGPSQACG